MNGSNRCDPHPTPELLAPHSPGCRAATSAAGAPDVTVYLTVEPVPHVRRGPWWRPWRSCGPTEPPTKGGRGGRALLAPYNNPSRPTRLNPRVSRLTTGRPGLGNLRGTGPGVLFLAARAAFGVPCIALEPLYWPRWSNACGLDRARLESA